MSKKITSETTNPPSASWSESRAKLLSDPEVRAAYDALEPEYTLIRELIDLRIKRGLSQRELAKRAGMKQPALVRVESGKTASLRTLRRVAEALNADVRVSIVPRQVKGKGNHTRR